MSRHVTSRHVTSRHVTSHHVTSRHVTSRRIATSQFIHFLGCVLSNCINLQKTLLRPQLAAGQPEFSISIYLSSSASSFANNKTDLRLRDAG
jgi:hypothetical protein